MAVAVYWYHPSSEESDYQHMTRLTAPPGIIQVAVRDVTLTVTTPNDPIWRDILKACGRVINSKVLTRGPIVSRIKSNPDRIMLIMDVRTNVEANTLKAGLLETFQKQGFTVQEPGKSIITSPGGTA